MDILFPLGGMNRRAGFQYQPPYITTDCVNVMPDSTQLGRRRGGSRPGIGAWSYGKYNSTNRQSDPLGSTPVWMLASVRYNDLSYYKVWEDKFDPPGIQPYWSAPAWGTIALPSLDSSGRVYATASTNKGMVREVISHNTTTPHAIAYTMLIVPQNGTFHGTYKIWFRMNSGTPVLTTDGFEVTLTLPRSGAGTFSCSANKYVSGVNTAYGPYTDATWASIFSTAWPIDYNDAATFTVVHDYATEIVRAYWLGYSILNPQVSPTQDGIDITGMSAGIRFGFGISGTAAATNRALCDSVRVNYQITSETKQFTKVVCSVNGTIYYVDPVASGMNWFTAIADWTLASDHKTNTAERNGKLYMADWGDTVYSNTSCVITNNGGAFQFNVGAGVNLVADYAINANDYVCEVVSVAGTNNSTTYPYQIGVFRFTLGSSGGTNNMVRLIRTTTLAASLSDETASIRIFRGPKVYNPVTNAVSSLDDNTDVMSDQTEGTVPYKYKLICAYRDRIVFAHSLSNPWAWEMSRQGDPTEYYYGASANDAQRAVAATSNDAGQIPEPITCLIPHGKDFLVFGCERSIWMLRGDPADGGRIDNVSRTVGIIDEDAWCWTPEGAIVFLSHDGLYMLVNGSVVSMSREALPRELIGVDPKVFQVQLQYDDKLRGVFVFLTQRIGSSASTASSANYHWFVDWETKGLWPIRLPTFAEPNSVHTLRSMSPSSLNGILIGGRDSYIRWMQRWFETDNGEDLANKVLIGPLRVGPDGSVDAELNEIFAVIGAESYSVTWRIYADETAERAYQRYLDGTSNAQASGTWSEHLNTREHPRVRGAVAYIEVAGSGTKPWALETITAKVIAGGNLRTVR